MDYADKLPPMLVGQFYAAAPVHDLAALDTGFSLRRLDKVEGEWTLVALAYNRKRLHKLSLAM